MQPWQCIALIVLSIAVFLYASFLDEINETANSSLAALSDNSTVSSETDPLRSDQDSSSTWAEVILILNSAIAEDYALSFHEESIDSPNFHARLLEELNASPIAKELILKPFTSDLIEGNELEILSSLLSIRPKSEKSLEIICKGHSIRAANLLSELIIRNYNKIIATETTDSPIPVSLAEKLNKFKNLESQWENLKVIIQEEMEGEPEESVEVMAIRSEIMQLDEEVSLFKKHLLKIDEIHKNKLNPNEFLHIPPIRDYGQVSQLADILEQLKSMRLDLTLNKYTRDQVEKNISANSKQLETEVIAAIEEIKQSVTQLLEKKRALQQAIFDHLSEAKLAQSKSTNVKKFSKIKQLMLEAKKEYEDATLLWMSCKSSYSLYRATN